jgi:hypothetical protein
MAEAFMRRVERAGGAERAGAARRRRRRRTHGGVERIGTRC